MLENNFEPMQTAVHHVTNIIRFFRVNGLQFIEMPTAMSIATAAARAASSFSMIDKSLSRKETQFLRNSTYNLWFSSVACLETAASYLPNYRLSHERHLTVKLRDKTTTTRLSDFFSSSSTTFDSLFESSWLTTSAMVSLLLTTRKIISSSFTHWPRMAFKWPQMIMRTEFAVQCGTFFA